MSDSENLYQPGAPRGIRPALRRTAGLMVGVAALSIALSGPAEAAKDVPDWTKAQSAVGRTLSLWRPTYTAGLPLQKPRGVQTEICNAPVRSAIAYATYSKGKKPSKPGKPSFIISEQVADNHCADGGYDWTGPVAKVSTKYGKATISAFCGWDAKRNEPVKGWNGKCRKSDVLAHGGAVVQWVPKRSGKGGVADISISTDGLRYKQLVRLVKGIRPVPGS